MRMLHWPRVVSVGRAVAVAFTVFLSPGPDNTVWAQRPVAGKGDVLTVAIPKFWPPHYIAENVPKPTGFAIEIFDAVAALAGYRVNYVIKPNFKEVNDALTRGEVDAVPNMGIIPARQKLMNFTDPVETFVVSLFVRTDTQGVAGLRDLYGKRVAAVKRNIANRILLDHPEIKPVVFNDIRAAVFDLLAGRVDGLIYPVPVVRSLAREIGISNRLKSVGPPLREIKRGIAVNLGRPDVHRRLDAATRNFVKTPEYQRIYTKYFGAPPDGLPLEEVLTIGGIGLVALIMLFSGWHYFTVMGLNRTLEQRVRSRTRELHEAQDDLVRAERLATLGELTGTMAHELRNPLGVVVSSFGAIKLGSGRPGHDVGASIARAERSIERCTRIIDELLDYAQVKTAHFAPVDVDRLVAEVLQDYEAPGNVTIRNELHAEGKSIDGDSEQLRRLLINFLDNGRDAIVQRLENETNFTGGTLLVSTRAVDDEIEIVVADDGVGIEPDGLEKIFEPLYSTKSFGVGLGLPNAQNIAVQHQGRITVESEPGKGTEMRVKLPLRAKELDRKAVA